MNKKKILCGSFAAALAVTSLAGCSKGSSVRKIEGASDDACKAISIMEEVYDMKGIALDMSMDVKGDAEGTSATGNVKFSGIIDSDNNMKVSVNADMKVQDKDIKGEIASFYFVDKTIYFDLSGAYSVIETAMGAEAVSSMLQMMKLTEDDLKAALCVSVPAGDFKASDFSIESMKSFMQPIMDDYAVAMTAASAVTAADGSYTIDLSGDNAKKFVEEFSKAFDKNGSDIYDKIVSYIEGLKIDTKAPGFVDAIAGEIAKGLTALSGQEMTAESMGLNTEEIKTKIADAIKELKDKKDDNLKSISKVFTDALSAEGAEADTAKVVIKDEKDGYTFKMPATVSGNIAGKSGSISGTAEGSVKSTSDKVSAPSKAVPLSTTIEKLGGVLTLVLNGMGGSQS